MMTDFPCHKSIRLQNFTVFKDLNLKFSPGINVFVGENGTGKTHPMKTLNGFQLNASHPEMSVVRKPKVGSSAGE